MRLHIKHITFTLLLLTFSSTIAQTVYTTKSGKKYHKIDCRYLKSSHYQTTIDKAKSLGYTACKVCKPTISNTKVSEQQILEYGSSPVQKKQKKSKTSSQCRGKTKSGRRCKRMTKNANKRCYQHQK
ncbi:hypothetical protein KORDIASMS9_02261 [Kordia sp. SMS9]|nr:hypothetical protein KORDIASMS9_02261 [Kordia sp. SMS9]